MTGKNDKSENDRNSTLSRRNILLASTTLAAASALATAASPQKAAAQAPSGSKPNIIVIMGDDIGMWNLGAYHRGMMAGRTPNLDKLAAEGMIFTDYYAEASCTAGRANFITGELPIRTGMTTVGQAGAPTGIPAQAVTIATALKGEWATPPASSARTILATKTNFCRPCTASTNSSAISITSMRWKIRRTPHTRRNC